MIRRGDLTPWQNRVGRAAVRFREARGAYLMGLGFALVAALSAAFLAWSRLAIDPDRALWFAGAAGFGIAIVLTNLANDPFASLAGRLYRELDGAESLESGGVPGALARARGGLERLSPADQRMMESARRIGRLGWGSVRGAVLVALASGIVTIAAALARFGSQAEGLGAAALLMAASGGLGIGVAIGLLILMRWMRLAERLGGPPGEGVTPG
jgi:hypothetical protein